MHLAVRSGDEKLVLMLLNAGASVNKLESYSQTALMVAAEIGNESLCRLLLEHDADVTLTNSLEQTAYDVAIENGHVEWAEILKVAKSIEPTKPGK